MKHIISLFIALSIAAPVSAMEQSSRGQSFILADTDQSSTLTRSEFKRFINLLAASGHRNAQRVKTFRLYSLAWVRVDADGNGAITRRELSRTQMAFGSSQRVIKIRTQ